VTLGKSSSPLFGVFQLEVNMRFRKKAGRGTALVALTAATTLVAAGCSAGSLGSSDEGAGGEAGAVTITWLTGSQDTEVASAKAAMEAFKAANPNITIEHDTRPGGSEGDNLVKTRLATGEMADVFIYNNGSLLQAIKPEQNLTPLDDQPWASTLDKTFVDSTKAADGKLYGGPYGTVQGGAVLYHIPTYEKLGLEIPQTWDEFMKNNDEVKKAGIAPVIQSYGETWTSQLFVLGDYHNVEAQVPDFAAQYTAGKMKYANTPAALEGFKHIQQVQEGGYLAENYRSAELNDGIKMIAEGQGAHYPQLGNTSANIENVAPGKSKDVGFFPIPGSDPASFGMTVWPGNGMYIPKTVEGEKLDAAKKFVEFMTTQPGCDAYAKGTPPSGPFLTTNCKLPADVSQVAKDTASYLEAGKASPALEFKSPIKGPALEQICIQVGTGQVTAEEGAKLYDEDVKKQAQQLGLPGWD
jgi:raffinose/stachyose/melibiose transport system substrate-binding protein